MPVFEVRFLIQAENQDSAREAIRIPGTPHTEPIIEQWGYYSQIDENSVGVYLSTLGKPGRKGQRQDISQGGSSRKPRADKGRPKTPEQIAAMKAGKEAAKLARQRMKVR